MNQFIFRKDEKVPVIRICEGVAFAVTLVMLIYVWMTVLP